MFCFSLNSFNSIKIVSWMFKPSVALPPLFFSYPSYLLYPVSTPQQPNTAWVFKIIPDLTASAENDEWAHVYPPVTTPNWNVAGASEHFECCYCSKYTKKKKNSLLWKSSDTAYRTSSPYHSEAAAIKINLKKNRKTGPRAKRNTRRMINRLDCETKTSSHSWRRCWWRY